MLDVVQTISVGELPLDVALSPDGARAYVTNFGDGTISVIDTATDAVTATIDVRGVGPHPMAAAVGPNGSRLYVTVYNDSGPLDKLAVIDTATNAVVAAAPVGHVPFDVAVSPDGGRAYVVCLEERSVSMIDTATNTVTATIGVSPLPARAAISQDGGRVYVTIPGDDKLDVINAAAAAVVTSIPVGGDGLSDIALHPDGARAFLTVGTSIVIINIATAAVLASIPVDVYPVRLTFSADGGECYVIGTDGAPAANGTLLVIDTDTRAVSDAIPIGSSPVAVAVHPSWTRLYAVNHHAGTVSVIAPVFAWRGRIPELVGRVFGGAAAGGGGWIVIGGRFYRIPPRSPLLARIAQVAAPHLGRPIVNDELGARIRTLE